MSKPKQHTGNGEQDALRGMTVAEYSRHRGVSRQRIERLRTTGRLVKTPDGGIDPTASDAALAVDRPRANIDYMAQLTRKTKASADRLEHDLQRKRRQLVDVGLVEEGLARWAINIKSALLALPSRMAMQVGWIDNRARAQGVATATKLVHALLRDLEGLCGSGLEGFALCDHCQAGLEEFTKTIVVPETMFPEKRD